MSAEKTITTSNLEYYHNETVKKLNNAVNELNSLVGKVNVPNAIADLSEQIEAASGTANGQQYNSSTNTTTFIKGNSLGSVKVGTLYIQDNSSSKNIVDFVNEKDNNLKSLIRTQDETHVSSQSFNLDKIDNRVQNCIFNAVKNWNLYSDLGTVNEQYTDDSSILPSLTVNVQKFDNAGRGTAWFTHYMQYFEARRIKPMRYDYVVANISHRGNVIYEQCYIIISNTSSDYNKHIYLHLHHHIHGDLVYHSLLTSTQFSEFKYHNYTTLEFKLTERTDAIEQNSELLITSGAVYDGLQEIKDIAAGSGHTYDPEKVSIAEGNSTAIGTHSHAEGNETNAKGINTHSEGYLTTANGKNAHAEGGLCLAFGTNSHAENDTTMALGDASHSEGVDSLAIGTASHAEGNGTIASEFGSHSSGEFTNALGKYSFVVGKSKLNKTFTFNIIEISVENFGNFQRNKIIITIEGRLPARIIKGVINSNILYLEKPGGSQLIYVSQVTIDSGMSVNTKIVVFTKNNYPCSSATETMGFTTGSFGEYAITAKGEASFVGGYVDGTNSSKICSITTDNNVSSGSIAYGTIFSRNASNDNNIIQTSAIASTAMGYIDDGTSVKIIATADGSLARGCIKESTSSIIESAGKGSIASGFIGQNSNGASIKTLDEGSISIGCIENATDSIITAGGKGSIASGYVTDNNCKIEASGDGSFAQGYVDSEYPNIIANSNGAHAEGIGTQANGYGAHAEGCGTQAFGDYSHAEGYVGAIIPDLSLYPDPISDVKYIKVYVNPTGDRICSFKTQPGVPPDIILNRTITLRNKRNVPYEYYPIKIENIAPVPGDDSFYFYVDSRIPLDSDSNNWSMFNGIPSCLGDVAHSEGNCTLASGDNSHAEGNFTIASGDNSHAEGDYTVASGYNSHAEGSYTNADGNYSHAEGHYSNANGGSSHAEGRYSNANGGNSHAEGWYTIADGDNSHAEGHYSNANGDASHAEGVETSANSEGAHAEGVGTYAGGFLFVNTGITASGRFNKNGLFFTQPIDVRIKVNSILVINDKERWVANVGTDPYYITFESPLSDDDVLWARNNNILLKDIDNNTNGAHAEGCYTRAIGKYSHAEGCGVYHNDDYFKLTEIDNTIKQLLWDNGYYYDVANCFWTPDDNVIGSGSYSAKLYTDDTFTSFVCDARCTYVDIEDAEGDSILTGGIIRVEDPSKLQLNTEYYQMVITDHAAKGEYSHTEGNNTNADGKYSHAEGSYTKADGIGAHAEGLSTTANGNGAHAEGHVTTADGISSHAEGYYSTAEGQGSHAEGQYTKAEGRGSHAGGVRTHAYEGMTAIGRYNSIDSAIYGPDILFAIGNGENDNNRKNVLNVNKNGNVYFNNNRVYYTEFNDFDCYIEVPEGTSKNLKIFADHDVILAGNNSVKIPSNDLFVTNDVYAKAFHPAGSDYAELFEWHDGNKKDEDRIGYFVTITTDGKIKKAKNTDEILGIVSACPGIIGNNPLEWHKKYKRDVFGRLLYDENNKPIINEEYDETQQYIRRSQRKEWSPIGLLGQLIVLDDGSCIAGKKCSVNKNGIATNGDSYLVLQRLDDNHIKILFK